MKKQTKIIGAIVIVIALVAIYFVYDAGYFELEENGVVPFTGGEMEVELALLDNNGNEYIITDSPANTMEVTNPAGTVVTSARIRLKASFSTPSGSESFDGVLFETQPGTYPTAGSGFEDATLNILVNQGSSPPIYSSEGNDVPHEFSQWGLPKPDDYFIETMSQTISFEDVFDGTDNSGEYKLIFDFGGNICYRPCMGSASNPTDCSDWRFIDLSNGLDGIITITYTGYDVTISWDSDVVWN